MIQGLCWQPLLLSFGRCEPSRFLEEINPEFIEESGIRKHKSNFIFDEHLPERWDKQHSTAKSTSSKTIIKKNTALVNLKKINSTEVKNFEGEDTTGIQTGMEVEHARFGVGKVLQVEGNAGDLKATVFFQGFGNKQLLLKFARLRIVG